jgi:hypothetical protein
MSVKKIIILIGALLVLSAILVACGKATETSTETTQPTAQPTATAVPTEAPLVVPFEEAWAASGHADGAAEAFNHWNNDEAKVVPAACAKCHSNTGIVDYLNGAPVDVPVPGGVVTCVTCHNVATVSLTSVTFPGTKDTPGATLTGLGPEARCIVCHQGRESKITMEAAVKDMEADTVNPDLGFKNIHYFAAAATQYGTEVKGGYEYDGQRYDAKFSHVEGLDTCIGCHDQHSLEVKVQTCAQCHEGVNTVEDLKNARQMGSLMDYDGDGNTTEGIYYEIQGLQELTFQAIQAYAKDVAGAQIAYNAAAYPYFFADANGNGQADEGETKYVNWTPRLLKAAYNYQLSVKDPGAFAHNAKYVIELLFDSITDLNTKLPTPVDLSKANREDAGHFAGNTEPFRHWDAADASGKPAFTVPYTCVKCHTATGLSMGLANGGNRIAQPSANGFMCSTCHDEANWPNRYVVASVTMPSGKVVSMGGKDADGKWVADDANLCISCHQGLESGASVAKAIGNGDPDTVVAGLGFKNVHYLAAGATLFGTEAQGMYEFAGNTYVGKNAHGDMGPNNCVACHETHSGEVKVDVCAACHKGVTDPEEIRAANDTTDWDGDGNVTEPLNDEIATMREKLYAAIQAYAKDKLGTAIAYNANAYPYFFIDTNGNGAVDPDEANFGNRYATWSPRLEIAAYNMQYSLKDPGAFAHNGKYILQVLFDTLKYMGADMTGMTRP